MPFSPSWHALSLFEGGEYVVVGCVHTDSGRSGRAACPLGLRGDARMAGARIVPATDHPRHCRSLLHMKAARSSHGYLTARQGKDKARRRSFQLGLPGLPLKLAVRSSKDREFPSAAFLHRRGQGQGQAAF